MATIKQKKPRILVHEADPAKGGARLEELRNELKDTEHRDAIFPEGYNVITWTRLADFQLQSLLMIVQQMLIWSPKYRDETEPLQLRIPGSILDKPLVFPFPVVLCKLSCPRTAGHLLLYISCLITLVRWLTSLDLAVQTSPGTTRVRPRRLRR